MKYIIESKIDINVFRVCLLHIVSNLLANFLLEVARILLTLVHKKKNFLLNRIAFLSIAINCFIVIQGRIS